MLRATKNMRQQIRNSPQKINTIVARPLVNFTC